ncbi:hypothetical protein PAXRUDRAFT_187453 [Paxillus rubicundulus Ve08.2h10]|uniref:Uncharacterized protein n=1 Tax=Paxillus rubicundulus Ve08.2h10 TaxID=930991 RepID=A0A0D0DPL4_9AGAM|nr:hypothetical protein PAXRUDRAFT_187453 [Paxillus rubicundulus Ve08.2h10]
MVVILRVEVRGPEPNHGTVVRPHRLPLFPVSFIYHPSLFSRPLAVFSQLIYLCSQT